MFATTVRLAGWREAILAKFTKKNLFCSIVLCFFTNRMLQQRKDEEVLAKEDEKQSESSDAESSSYEEESESEEENEPRLKPLFVSKKDRATITEKEKEIQKQKQIEYEAKRLAKERRRQTLRMVEESVKKDLEKAKVLDMTQRHYKNTLKTTI